MAQSGYSPISLDVQGVQFSDFHTRSQTIRLKGITSSILKQNNKECRQNKCDSFCDRLKVLFFWTGNIFGQLLPKEEDFSQALYTFDIGQNDLTSGYKLNMSTEQVKAYVPDLLSQLSNVIKVSESEPNYNN